MKRKFLIIGIMVALMAMVVGGATFAWFTDTATSSDNTFTSGTVDIDAYRDGFDTIDGPMFYTTKEEGATQDGTKGLKATGLWAPGDSVVRSLVVHNGPYSLDSVLYKAQAVDQSSSTLPAGYTDEMKVKIYKICPSGWFKENPNGNAPYLAMNDEEMNDVREFFNEFLVSYVPGVPGYAQGKIEDAINNGASYGWFGKIKPVLLWEGTLSQLMAAPQAFSNPVYLYNYAWEGEAIRNGALLAFVVNMDKDAGNEYQGIEPKFRFDVIATQQKNNFEPPLP